jgi:hypothetical protein
MRLLTLLFKLNCSCILGRCMFIHYLFVWDHFFKYAFVFIVCSVRAVHDQVPLATVGAFSIRVSSSSRSLVLFSIQVNACKYIYKHSLVQIFFKNLHFAILMHMASIDRVADNSFFFRRFREIIPYRRGCNRYQ